MGVVKMIIGESTSIVALASGCRPSISILLTNTATAISQGRARMVRERSGISRRFHSNSTAHTRCVVTFRSVTAKTIMVLRG